MKRTLQTTLTVLGLAALLSPSARAQYNPNDLLLGFTQNGAQNDYIIDLGNANTAVGVGGASWTDLTSLFNSSTFNSTFSGGLGSGVNIGVIGGNQAFSGRDLYVTSLRNSFGTPDLPGSTAPAAIGATPISSGVGDASSLVNGLSLTPGGSATPLQAAANSWSSLISPGLNPPSFTIDTGLDPMGQASSSVVYEDLYRGTPNQPFSYVGYFTLDMSGSGSLTFTPSAATVPEPSTFGLLISGVVLATLFRRWFLCRAR